MLHPLANRPRRHPGLVLAALAALLAPACASSGKPMPEVAAEINATLDPAPGRFLPGDIVNVRFPHDPDKDQSVRVDMNGNASLLLIGTVSVVGKRPEQLREELEGAYKTQLTNPDLIVNLQLQAPGGVDLPPNRAIHVLGEVRAPGGFPCLGQQVTLIDALARSGGHLKATALLKDILLVRYMPEQRNWRAWHIDARPDNWGSAKQILLQANDVVYVPNTPIDDVDIWIDQYIRQLIPFPYLIPPSTWSRP